MPRLTLLLPQEGAGHAVLSASVEITFDNSTGRIPVRPPPCLHGVASNVLSACLLSANTPKSNRLS